jgi:phage host-nuclease inhibitor protein Gam
LKDLAISQISKLNENIKTLEKEIEKLSVHYNNKLLEKRKEVNEKEKFLRAEMNEKIAEVERKYKQQLEFLRMIDVLIEVSNKYSDLEKTLDIQSKNFTNLESWMYEKERLKRQIASEKETIKKKYEEAITKLYNEIADLERERDGKIKQIARNIEELNNKIAEVNVRTNKQISEIQDGYRKNVLNIDAVIEKLRKLIKNKR